MQIQNDPVCAAQIQATSSAACTGSCRALIDDVVTYCAGQVRTNVFMYVHCAHRAVIITHSF